MDAEQLLAELEALPYSARLGRMVQLGKQVANKTVSRTVLDVLERDHGFYGKQLAIQACFGTRDAEKALTYFSGSSKHLRQLAWQVVVNVASDDQLLEVLSKAPTKQLPTLLRQVVKTGKRQAVIERLVDFVASRNDWKVLEPILSYGSNQQVTQYWPSVESIATSCTWRRLAMRHPDYTAQRIKVLESPYRRASSLSSALPFLVQHCPEAAWEAFLAVPPSQHDHVLNLEHLVGRFPTRAATLFLSPHVPPPASLAAPPADKDKDDLAELDPAVVQARELMADPQPREVYRLVAKTRTASQLPGSVTKRLRKLDTAQQLQVLLEENDLAGVLKRLRGDQPSQLFRAWQAAWQHQAQALSDLQASLGGDKAALTEAQELAAQVRRLYLRVWRLQAPAVEAGEGRDPAALREAAEVKLWCRALPLTLRHELAEILLAQSQDEIPQPLIASLAEGGSDRLLQLMTKHLSHRVFKDQASMKPAKLVRYMTVDQVSQLHAAIHQAGQKALDATLRVAFIPVESRLVNRLAEKHSHWLPSHMSGMDADKVKTELQAALQYIPKNQLQVLYERLMAESHPAGTVWTDIAAASDTPRSYFELFEDPPSAACGDADLVMSSPPETPAGPPLASLGLPVAEDLPGGLWEKLGPEVWKWWTQWWMNLRKDIDLAVARLAPRPGGAIDDPSPSPAPSRLTHLLKSALSYWVQRTALLPWLKAKKHLNPMQLHSLSSAILLHWNQKSEASQVDELLLLLTPSQLSEMTQLDKSRFLTSPPLLLALPADKRLQLLTEWKSCRQAGESALGELLGSCPPALTQGLTTPVKKRLKTHSPISPDLIKQLDHADEAARRTLFEGYRDLWLMDWGAAPELLPYLPDPERGAIARLLIARVIRTQQPSAVFNQVKTYLLPSLSWSEMCEEPCFKELLQAKEVDTRWTAIACIFTMLEHRPEWLGKLLELLHARRRESDVLRLNWLTQLETLGYKWDEPRGLKDLGPHLPAIQVLIEDGLSASDLSHPSMRCMAKLACQQMTHHGQWMGRCLALVAAVQGVPAHILYVIKSALEGERERYLKDPALAEQLLDNFQGVFDSLATRPDGGCQMMQLILELAPTVTRHTSKSDITKDDAEALKGVHQRLAALCGQVCGVLAQKPFLESGLPDKLCSFAELVLTHLPSAFSQLHASLLPNDDVWLANELDTEVMTTILRKYGSDLTWDQLKPFITNNEWMPCTGGVALQQARRYHRDKVFPVLSEVISHDPSWLQLRWVLHLAMGYGSQMLSPLLASSKMEEGLFGNGGHVKAEYAIEGKDGKLDGTDPLENVSKSISFWLALPNLEGLGWCRLTAKQQAALSNSLMALLTEGGLSIQNMRPLVELLASLPTVDPQPLMELMDGQQGPAAEAAKSLMLAALTQLDDGDKAWQAIASACQASQGKGLARTAASSLLMRCHADWTTTETRLRSLPWQYPGMMKEVVRLLARLYDGGERAALDVLMEIAGGAKVHRSVWEVLLPVLAPHIALPEVSQAFRRAAAHGEAEVACAAASGLVSCKEIIKGSNAVASFAVEVIESLLRHRESKVRLAAMSSFQQLVMPMAIAQPLVTILSQVKNKCKNSVEAEQASNSLMAWFRAYMYAAPDVGSLPLGLTTAALSSSDAPMVPPSVTATSGFEMVEAEDDDDEVDDDDDMDTD